MRNMFHLAVRVLIAVAVGAYLLRFRDSPLLLPFIGIMYGVILFLLFGVPLLRRAGRGASQLFWPDDKHFRILPEYSIAEARLKQGQYEAAVGEFRKVIAQYPADVYAHVRIAEIAVEHLRDFKLAETELLSAVAKAADPDNSALTGGRLADFYQHTLHDPKRALEVMMTLKARLANTKHARLVDQRIETLRKMVGGYEVPKPPAKIAFRPADEETVRRRRGF